MSLSLKEAKKIVVTGGAGFLGKPIVAELIKNGAPEEAIVVPRSASEDLRDFSVCMRVTEGADLVIHLAAKVGGIGYNQRNPGTLFFDNASMGINIIEAARRNNVGKLVVSGTTCSYPKFCPVPFKEENLWNGYPEETNAPYGIAKKSLLVMVQAYREQYGLNGIYVLPVNLYGPYDNFDLEDSHVIAALVRKFVHAKKNGINEVELWGDGTPTREFLYVDDAAEGIIKAALHYESSEPVNIGSSHEISIKDLAEQIRALIGFEGRLIWNTDRPNGQPKRRLDISRAKKEFGFLSQTSFESGLSKTINWWESTL